MSVDLGNQHAKHVHHIIPASVACLAVPHFPSSHEQHNFWKEVTEHKMYIFIFSTSSVWNISHAQKNWVRYDQNFVKIAHYVRFKWSLNFLNRFLKTICIKFHYNPPSGSRVVPCGQTDTTKLIVIFHIFVTTPKNVPQILESPPKVSFLLSCCGGACMGIWPWELCQQ